MDESQTTIRTDFSGNRYWYIGHGEEIKRLDTSVSPPTETHATGEWHDRETLEYV